MEHFTPKPTRLPGKGLLTTIFHVQHMRLPDNTGSMEYGPYTRMSVARHLTNCKNESTERPIVRDCLSSNPV